MGDIATPKVRRRIVEFLGVSLLPENLARCGVEGGQRAVDAQSEERVPATTGVAFGPFP